MGLIMITLDQAVALKHGAILHHMYQTQGGSRLKSPLRVRVTGQCKTWKTRPGEFRIPVKHGLRESGEITHLTAEHWVVA